MKVVNVSTFSGSKDLIVTVNCAECEAEHRLLVPDGVQEIEHIHQCPLFDRTAYLNDWAYSIYCPTCGAEDTDDLRLEVCRCGDLGDFAVIEGMAWEAFNYCSDKYKATGMCGWIANSGGLDILVNLDGVGRTASISLNEDTERNGERYPELCLVVEENRKIIYTSDIELPMDAKTADYVGAVQSLKGEAELRLYGEMCPV